MFNFNLWYAARSSVCTFVFGAQGSISWRVLKRFKFNTGVLEDFYIALKTRQTGFRTLIPF